MHKKREELSESYRLPQASWRAEDWGEMHVSFETYHQRLDDRPLLQGLPGDHCRCPHWGYVLEGGLRVLYQDREEEIRAGEAYHLEPGHSIIVEAGTRLFELSPREAFAAHMAAVEESQRRRRAASEEDRP